MTVIHLPDEWVLALGIQALLRTLVDLPGLEHTGMTRLKELLSSPPATAS